MPQSPPLTRFGTPLLDRAASAARRVWFRLCTRAVDRHGTIIEPGGVDLTSHKQNPVFLWMHDSGGEGRPTPPPDIVIGRVTTYDQTDEYLDIEVEFDDDGPDGLASTCFRKVKDGFIRMVSIGCSGAFDSATLVDGVEVPTCGHSELLECSLVIIGSNRQALKLDRAVEAAWLRSLARDVGSEAVPSAASASDGMSAPPIRIPRQVASVAAFNHRGDMLWGKRRDSGKWTTPGGHLNVGEDPATAARRELREEAGIEAAVLDYLAPVEITRPEGDSVFVHCFRADVGDAVPTSQHDPDQEVAEWSWVSLGDDRALPEHVAANLHAPRNAFRTLGVFRAIFGGDVAAQPILTDVVDDGSIGSVLDEGDEGDGLVVKALRHTLRHHTTVIRGVVPFKAFPVSDGPWDADAAVGRWRRWASKDGSGNKDTIDWKRYAECFLWFDDTDPEHFSSYKFPHSDIVRGVPVTMWRGVVAAAGRLDQADGIPDDDLDRMRSHLSSHYKEFHKTPPWQQRDLGEVVATLRRAWEGLDEAKLPQLLPDALRAAFAGAVTVAVPVPVHPVIDSPSHTPVHSDGEPFLMAKTTPYGLMFPMSRYSAADAAKWCQDHGYFPAPAREVGDGFSHWGLSVTENSLWVEQLPESLFQPAPFGVGLKWQTVMAADGVAVVYGILKTKRGVDREAVRRAVCARAKLTASPSAKAEVAVLRGAAAELRSVATTGAWSLPALRGVVASTVPAIAKDVKRVVAELRAATTPSPVLYGDLDAAAVLRHAALFRNAPHYLTSARAEPALRRSTTSTSKDPATMMKTPMARAAYRGMIQHALEHADMHVRAMEDGHVSDEMKPQHRAMAMRALDSADEMHEMGRSAFLGNVSKQDIVVDSGSSTDGEVYNIPRTADVEMSTRFAAVAQKVGKLPRSLRGIVQSELGTIDGEVVEEKLMGFKSDRSALVELRQTATAAASKLDRADCERAIEGALEARLLTPADAKKLRGIDAATGAATGQPWGKARVERYIAERAEVGPVADIQRPGTVRTVQQDEQSHNIRSASPTATHEVSDFAAQVAAGIAAWDSAAQPGLDGKGQPLPRSKPLSATDIVSAMNGGTRRIRMNYASASEMPGSGK